jgi:hypothetical protein
MDTDSDVKEIIRASNYSNLFVDIPSTDHLSLGSLFILRKDDIPSIEHRDLDPEDIDKSQLQLVNKDRKVYASVIDINRPEYKVIRDEWKFENEKDSLDLKVQLTIAFKTTILWKKDRDVVQVDVTSEYKEQGIESDLNEIGILQNAKSKADS